MSFCLQLWFVSDPDGSVNQWKWAESNDFTGSFMLLVLMALDVIDHWSWMIVSVVSSIAALVCSSRITLASRYGVCLILVCTYLLLACDEGVGHLLPRVRAVVVGGDLLDGFGHVCETQNRSTWTFSSDSAWETHGVTSAVGNAVKLDVSTCCDPPFSDLITRALWPNVSSTSAPRDANE